MIHDPIQGIAFERSSLHKVAHAPAHKTAGKTKYEKHFKFTWPGRHKKVSNPEVVVIEPDPRDVLIDNFRTRK